MKKIINKILYYIISGVWYGLSLLPLRLLYVISDLMFLILADFIRYRRRTILKNLHDSFPKKDEKEIIIIMLKFYHRFCDYIVETVKLMSMSKKQAMRRIKFEGVEEMNQVLEQGQSVALLLSHTFNWELISTIPYWVDKEVVCGEIYHPLENQIFDRLTLRMREKNNAVGVPMKDTLRQIISWQQQGKRHIMGYLYDQKPMWQNIHHWVDFLNHDTPVLTGAERISKATGEAVFYGDMQRVKRGYYVCRLRLIAENPKDIPNWEITDKYYQLLEETIHRQPELWLWSHKRWKRTREQFNQRFTIVNGKVVEKPKPENK